MKKCIAAILSLFLAAGLAFAQSEVSALEDGPTVDLTKLTIVPGNQHIAEDDKTGKVEMEYIPMVDELRIYYTCMYNLYEQGRAMNSILGCLTDCMKQSNDEENPLKEYVEPHGIQYYNYKYMEKDRERYFKDSRGIRWAQYSVHVKLVQ